MLRIPPTLATIGFRALGAVSATSRALSSHIDPFFGRNAILAYGNLASPVIGSGLERLFGALGDMKAGVQESRPYIEAYFSQFPKLLDHPSGERLLDIVSSPSESDREGFPKIRLSAFRAFEDRVPHLFSNGNSLLGWLDALEASLKAPQGLLLDETCESFQRSINTLRTMVLTAAVTAPPDLWLMRQILATYARLDLLNRWEEGGEIVLKNDSVRLGFHEAQFSYDVHFLWSRGILERSARGFVKSRSCPFSLGTDLELADEFRTDMTGLLAQGFRGLLAPKEEALVDRWFRFPPESSQNQGWRASRCELEVGYRLLPTVLGLNAAGVLKGLRQGNRFPDVRWNEWVQYVLGLAGVLEGNTVTPLGARVFERGPGVYGIIGAYHPYLSRHEFLLRAVGEKPHVVRGPNIAASRDANRKSFQDAVEILRDYARETGARYRTVIEHAMGLGIGIQEFRKVFGDWGVRFYGVDFEEAALEGARRESAEGRLPKQMKLFRADIGNPSPLLDFLRQEGALQEESAGGGTIMIVGNGFHEARGKSDEELIATLRLYREAGIMIVFTEESGLQDRQVRDAGWNTYHAGFRWTHQVSGQGLRAPWPMAGPSGRLSWTECAERAGYRVPREFRRGTRTVFPCNLPEDGNPPISVTFLCIPT